jgi:glucose-1-phosphate cytidylyltransferase
VVNHVLVGYSAVVREITMTQAGAPHPSGMKVVILAGGFGTRLAERTDEMPKPMVEVGGMPILWHIMKIYGHFGFNDFLIACGYKGEQIKRFFLDYRDRSSDLTVDYAANEVARTARDIEPWRVSLVDTGPDTMTGGRLKRLAEHIGAAPFFMTYGDGVADIDIGLLLRFHREHGRLATITTVHTPSSFGRPNLEGDRVVSFQEKPGDPDRWINGGFFVLEPGVLDMIEGDHTSLERDVLPRLAASGELMAHRHAGFWRPMDTLRDVRLLNTLWSEPRPPWRIWDS